MKRRDALLGSGLAAITAAALTLMSAAQASEAPPPLAEENIVLVDSSGSAAVADTENPHVLAKPHAKWALGTAIGAALAALASAVGFNRLMGWLARSGRAAAKAAVSAAAVPAQAAKSAAVAMGKAVASPGKALLGAGLVGVFLLASIAVLDLEWKIGLLVGATVAVSGLMGLNKLRRPQPVPVRND